MLALNLIQVCQNWLKFVMVECQVLRYEAGRNDKHFVDTFPDFLEGFGTFKNNTDEAHVMICVLVRLDKNKNVNNGNCSYNW